MAEEQQTIKDKEGKLDMRGMRKIKEGVKESEKKVKKRERRKVRKGKVSKKG